MNESILPDAESFRRAVRWIADERLRDPHRPRLDLIDEAGRRFDLSPPESEFLIRALEEGTEAPAQSP